MKDKIEPRTTFESWGIYPSDMRSSFLGENADKAIETASKNPELCRLFGMPCIISFPPAVIELENRLEIMTPVSEWNQDDRNKCGRLFTDIMKAPELKDCDEFLFRVTYEPKALGLIKIHVLLKEARGPIINSYGYVYSAEAN